MALEITAVPVQGQPMAAAAEVLVLPEQPVYQQVQPVALA